MSAESYVAALRAAERDYTAALARLEVAHIQLAAATDEALKLCRVIVTLGTLEGEDVITYDQQWTDLVHAKHLHDKLREKRGKR